MTTLWARLLLSSSLSEEIGFTGWPISQFAWGWGVSQDMELGILKQGQSGINGGDLVTLGPEKLNNLSEVTQLEGGWARIQN